MWFGALLKKLTFRFWIIYGDSENNQNHKETKKMPIGARTAVKDNPLGVN